MSLTASSIRKSNSEHVSPALQSLDTAATPVSEARTPKWQHLAALTASTVALAIAARLLLMSGFSGTDDLVYALRGLEIGNSIWRYSIDPTELRFGISLPIAAFVQAFGSDTLVLTGWSLLMSAVEVASVCLVAGYFWGIRTGLLAGLIMAVVPIHIILAGRTLADAPFAAFTTLAFAALMVAEHRQSSLFSAVVGVALGACWWIKPTASMPIFFAIAAYAIVFRRLDRRWVWTVVACGVMIVAEWIFLWISFGDPLLTLKVLFPFLRAHREYTGDPFWGTSSPWFYFHLLFLDLREMWILPHIALLGAMVLAFGRLALPGERFACTFVIYWAAILLVVYSFFFISVNPVKFIPKQENYALVFVAPLALLAAWSLSRLSPSLQVTTMSILVAGGLILASIVQQIHHDKYSRLVQAIEFAILHPNTTVFVSAQTMKVAALRALQTNALAPANLRPLAAFDPVLTPPGSLPSSIRNIPYRAPYNGSVLVLEHSSGEMARAETNVLFTQLEACATEVGRILSRPSGISSYTVEFLAALRPHLPAAIDRQIAYTNKILVPPEASLRRITADCPAPAGLARN